MQNADTQRARYRFKVKEGTGGYCWIMAEPSGADLKIFGPHGGFLGFELGEGATYEQAQAVATVLNDNVKMVTCTIFEPPQSL